MNTASSSQTVAITGANGFIGRYLVSALSEYENISIRILVRKPSADKKILPDNVIEVEGDLSKAETIREFLVPSCTVINLAYDFSSKKDANLLLINNLIDECKKQSVKKLIHCSTAAVYGRTKEDYVDESSECNPRSNYGKTKLLIEKIFLSGSKDNFQYVNVRPTAVYGPEGHALMKLFNNIFNGRSILNYLRACLFNVRELNLVHVTNVVSAIIFLMYIDKKVDGETYIVSEDFNSSNKFNYVEKLILEKTHNKYYFIPPIKLPLTILSFLLRMLRHDSVNPRVKYKADKIKQLGFEYKIDLDSGLSELIEWYKYEKNLKSGDT